VKAEAVSPVPISISPVVKATPPPLPAPPVHIAHEAEYIDVVNNYVRSARGWLDGTYNVTFDSRDGDRLIFQVDYLRGDSASTLVINDASSFKVELDPTHKRVEREIY